MMRGEGRTANTRRWRKNLRYLRWTCKVAFLLLFIVPVAYLANAPWVSGYSFLLGGSTLIKTYISVPITQSVCSIWAGGFGNTNPGAWILCPLGATQVLLTGEVAIITIVAMLLFFLPIVVLGNVFCSWACPIGTMVDSFDKGVEKFLPKAEAKRAKRSQKSRESKNREHVNPLLCRSCPVGKVKSKRYGVLANGILATSLLGSAILRFPVFCVVCPIGISNRGLTHLRSLSSITGKLLPVILELWAIPIVAVVASLRERRFWCKKLCPIAPLLEGAGALNPLIKLRVKDEKCVMKGCPEDCEDSRLDMCFFCRTMDDRKCEKVCPVDIDLLDHASLARCTKCLECYVVCDYNAIKIDLLGKPEVSSIGGFFRRLRGRRRENQVTPVENQSGAVG
jgi:ferredoxin-type protein NapH